MPIKVGGVFRDTKAWWVKVSGTWREGKSVFTKVSGVWREEAFIEPLSASAFPTFLSGFGGGGGPAFTGLCSTSVTGGVPPYSYLWAFQSGNTDIFASSATNFSTSFGSFTNSMAVWNCRVTDSDSTVVFTNNVSIEIEKL